MEGGPDPDCRRAYPVAPDAAQLAHRAFVRAVVHARRQWLPLRRGRSRVVAAAGGAIAIGRDADGERALVALNASREPARLAVEPSLLAGLEPVPLPEIAPGRVAEPGVVELPPQAALILA